MQYFRKYISYLLILSFIAINSFGFALSASANLNGEEDILICTNEGIKYLLVDGSISDTKDSNTFHSYCNDCTVCDCKFNNSSRYNLITVNHTKQRFISFKSNFIKYSLFDYNSIRGPPLRS